MEKLISCCGLNCAECEARIAYVNNDNDLRIQTAEKWSTMYGSDIKPEMVNCTGCLAPDGIKLAHCTTCAIRLCAVSKSFTTCGECDQVEQCETIAHVLKFAPHALANLKSLN